MPSVELKPAVSADAAIIHELVRASEVHDGEPLITPPEQIEEMFDDPHIEPGSDIRVAEMDGRAVGYGVVWHRPSEARQEQAYLFGTVHPDHRRRGAGRTLFSWQVGRGRALLEARPQGLPRYLRTSAWSWLADAQRLYERFGFTAVRWFDELLRPLDPLPSPKPVAGVEIEPWESDRDDHVRQVHNTSFADHWGSTVIGPEAWSHRLGRHGVRLDLSFLAVAEGNVVGYALNEVFPDDEALLGRRDGWIGGLGVLPAFRGRGIATALITASLDAFSQAGLTHASIGVDADNPTGAHRLYRRLGFVPEKRSVTHELTV